MTYVDVDRRAARFFGDGELLRAELSTLRPEGADAGQVAFLHADYATPLPLPDASFDLLISLFAGPVWDRCRRYLRPGGLLLANASHGDASLAALDPDLRLVAAVLHRDGRYRLDVEGLDGYLVARRPETAAPEAIRRAGRGIAYTRPAFAYVFRLDA